jgi:hypothetical protein
MDGEDLDDKHYMLLQGYRYPQFRTANKIAMKTQIMNHSKE